MSIDDLSRRAIPESAKIRFWTAPDGYRLRTFDWPASTRVAPRGSILFQTGRGDMFEKYLESLAEWHAEGWRVTAFDWRGQGGSGRLTDRQHVGHIEDFAIYIKDLSAFWSDWAATAEGPLVAIGHSMGGHLVLRGLVERALMPAAAVLIAPMLGLHAPISARFGEWLAKILGRFGKNSRPAWKGNEKPYTTDTRQTLLTHDPERYADELWWQQHDPALVTGPPSWRWVIEAFRSTRELRDNPKLAEMRVPTLMLIADKDALVSPKAALAIAAKLPDVEVVRFGPESAHEILRETYPVRDRAISAIRNFLTALPGEQA